MFSQVLIDLENKKWSVQDHLFDKILTQDLAAELSDLYENRQFTQAHIGKSISSTSSSTLDKSIRSDFIYWLKDISTVQCELKIRKALFEFQKLLNEYFYLNLKRFEFHYAMYPPGSHYDKHLDQHKGSNKRVVTMVHYLNPSWQPSFGGHLQIFDPQASENLLFSIEPINNRTVFFLSDVFPHEVELSNQTRLSFTGWFRNDEL